MIVTAVPVWVEELVLMALIFMHMFFTILWEPVSSYERIFLTHCVNIYGYFSFRFFDCVYFLVTKVTPRQLKLLAAVNSSIDWNSRPNANNVSPQIPNILIGSMLVKSSWSQSVDLLIREGPFIGNNRRWCDNFPQKNFCKGNLSKKILQAVIPKSNKSYALEKNSCRQAGFLKKFMHQTFFTLPPIIFNGPETDKCQSNPCQNDETCMGGVYCFSCIMYKYLDWFTLPWR